MPLLLAAAVGKKLCRSEELGTAAGESNTFLCVAPIFGLPAASVGRLTLIVSATPGGNPKSFLSGISIWGIFGKQQGSNLNLQMAKSARHGRAEARVRSDPFWDYLLLL